jgi:flagellar hook protein FlgE
MIITADLGDISGISSTGSTLNLTQQDGTSPGTLTSYVIDEQGVINGAFDNGIVRTLGQIVLARFSNPGGLLQDGFDNWKEGISSGLPQLTTPGSFGSGTIRSGSIELSNTDIGRNLVDLIVASTNYRGNARVISSVDQLVNELLVLGRG